MKPLLICLVACALSTSIFAQGEVEKKEMSSHERAAEQLLIISSADKNMQKMAKTISESQLRNLPPGIPPTQAKKMRAAIEGWTDKTLSWENMRGPMIELYVESYTEEETNEIIAFYKTPTGAKFLKLNPELTQKSAMITQALANKNQAELIKAITKAMSP